MSGTDLRTSYLSTTLLTHTLKDNFDFDGISAFNTGPFMDACDPAMFGEDAATGADAGLASFQAMPTVSPEQLMNNSFSSAPSSGNFDGTPFTDYASYTTSPAFQTMDASGGASLFGVKPDNALLDFASVPMARNLSDTSISSGNGAAAFGHAKRPSLTKLHTSSSSGVTKPRQRRQTKLLPDIALDNADPITRKRQKNTLAARVSRKKKAERMDNLEATVEALRTELSARGYDGPLLTEYIELDETEL
jgi:hypothetical protein